MEGGDGEHYHDWWLVIGDAKHYHNLVKDGNDVGHQWKVGMAIIVVVRI